MCEVTNKNFDHLYPKIKENIENARFFGFDLEFSCLNPLQKPSLFDSPTERYKKLKENLELTIPIQVGLTAFHFDSAKNSYSGKTYSFYVRPASFQYIDKPFFFQSSTLNFLNLYNFDFNKFSRDGIPYINREQEELLKLKLKTNDICDSNSHSKLYLEKLVDKYLIIVNDWYLKAQPGDCLSILKIGDSLHYDPEVLFFLHKVFRNRIDHLWTYVSNGEFIVKKIKRTELKSLIATNSVEENLVDNLLGFTKVFRLLVESKKPIIGHNVLQDLILILNSFEKNLPNSYNGFKYLITSLFPSIFDTKHISYQLRDVVTEDQRWNKDLETIFDYFKNGPGRHLAPNSPIIEVDGDPSIYEKYHDAGWDSFCAGYIFIRLAHLNIHKKYPQSKKFVPNEYIGSLMHCKNQINVIRGSISSINLDGPDPSSTRPPYLIIQSLKNKPISLFQVTEMLSTFGFFEAKKYPYCKTKAILAIDNFGNAKRIIRAFQTNKEFQIQQYSLFRHSLVVRALLMSGLGITGAVVLWLSTKK